MNALFLSFLIVYFTLQLPVLLRILIIIGACLYFSRKKNVLAVILILCMIVRPYLQPVYVQNQPVTGIVIKVYDSSFLMNTVYGKFLVIDDVEILIDSIVQVEGKVFSNEDSNYFFEVPSVSDVSMISDKVDVVVSGFSLRSFIHRKTSQIEDPLEKELMEKMLLRFSSDESFLDVASSVQIVVLMRWLKKRLKRFFYEETVEKIEIVLLIFLSFLLGGWMVCFRIFFFEFARKRHLSFYEALGIYSSIIYLWNPQLTFASSFWYGVLIRLSLKSFQFSYIGFYMTMMMVSCCFYACADIGELLLFPVLQTVSLLCFLVCTVRLFHPFSLYPLIESLQWFSDVFPHIEIHGNIPLIVILVLIAVASKLNHHIQSIIYCVTVSLLLSIGFMPFGRVVYFNVGQGDSALIQIPLSDITVLIDTGPPSSYYQLRNSLYAQSVYEIDLLIVTHSDSDHSGNLESLCQDFHVKEIWDNTIDLKVHSLLNLRQINSFESDEEDNEKSLAHVFSLNDLNYLFCGDAGVEKEKEYVLLLSEKIDVCKIGHHGSKTSTSWKLLDYAGCQVAIISAGLNNRYGHPHDEVIGRLEKNGSIVLNTQIHGDIQILMTRFFNLITTSNHEFGIIFKK